MTDDDLFIVSFFYTFFNKFTFTEGLPLNGKYEWAIICLTCFVLNFSTLSKGPKSFTFNIYYWNIEGKRVFQKISSSLLEKVIVYMNEERPMGDIKKIVNVCELLSMELNEVTFFLNIESSYRQYLAKHNPEEMLEILNKYGAYACRLEIFNEKNIDTINKYPLIVALLKIDSVYQTHKEKRLLAKLKNRCKRKHELHQKRKKPLLLVLEKIVNKVYVKKNFFK